MKEYALNRSNHLLTEINLRNKTRRSLSAPHSTLQPKLRPDNTFHYFPMASYIETQSLHVSIQPPTASQPEEITMINTSSSPIRQSDEEVKQDSIEDLLHYLHNNKKDNKVHKDHCPYCKKSIYILENDSNRGKCERCVAVFCVACKQSYHPPERCRVIISYRHRKDVSLAEERKVGLIPTEI